MLSTFHPQLSVPLPVIIVSCLIHCEGTTFRQALGFNVPSSSSFLQNSSPSSASPRGSSWSPFCSHRQHLLGRWMLKARHFRLSLLEPKISIEYLSTHLPHFPSSLHPPLEPQLFSVNGLSRKHENPVRGSLFGIIRHTRRDPCITRFCLTPFCSSVLSQSSPPPPSRKDVSSSLHCNSFISVFPFAQHRSSALHLVPTPSADKRSSSGWGGEKLFVD